MTSANPTLLIGLGAFGRAVTRLLAAPEAGNRALPARPLEIIEAALAPADSADSADSADHADHADSADRADHAGRVHAITAEARARCRRLLELGHFVDTTAPTDSRGPRLDIFVIGDLGEAGVARVVPLLVESLAVELRFAFRPILGRGEGALAVCPMLVAPRSAEAETLAMAVRALAALARHPERQRRPQARIYIIEDQSGKYLLTPEELERSFAAFLSLLLMSKLRDDRGVRDLVEPDDSDRVGPLATFACATLEIDTAALHELCALRLAREMLEHFDAGVLTLSEIASEAHPLVPDRTTVESFLWKEGTEGTLEEYLEPPRIPVPDIAFDDSPEDIVDHQFGPMWQLEAERAITAFRDEVERFKMDRLAGQIEKNGTELSARVEAELMERVRAEALASPRGPERALEFARYAATRARGLMHETRRAIDSPNLRALPGSPVASGIDAVDRAARAWPRPHRMRFFGVLVALSSTFVIASLVHMALDIIGRPLPWWLSAAAGLAISAPMVSYNLWRHRKQHHNWLCQARNDLDQAIQRHLHRDLVDYFRRRLEYSRALWMYRIYRRIADQLDQVVIQLEAGRAAVDEARRRLAAREHDLIQQRVSPEKSRGGILYRSVLDPGTVDGFYRHARPPDLAATAVRYHVHVTGQSAGQSAGADVLEAPYADPEHAMAFASREFAHVSEHSPYEQADSPLYRAVADSVKRYLEQLALKLSPPLEVIVANAPDAPSPSRILIAPPEARELIERILASENLDRGWDIRTISGDGRRIHLLLERGDLPVDALALAAPPGPRVHREPGPSAEVDAP